MRPPCPPTSIICCFLGPAAAEGAQRGGNTWLQQLYCKIMERMGRKIRKWMARRRGQAGPVGAGQWAQTAPTRWASRFIPACILTRGAGRAGPPRRMLYKVVLVG